MYVKYTYEQLKRFCCDAFLKFGFSADEAQKNYRRFTAFRRLRH